MIESKGIILKLVPYRDADLIATVLTTELGKISCLARSARKSKHRFFSGLQVFDSGIFTFSKFKGKNLILEGLTNKTSMNDIGKKPSNFLLASLFSEIIDKIVPDEDPDYSSIVRNLNFTLGKLNKSNQGLDQLCLATWFLIKIASTCGIDPGSTDRVFRKDDLEWYHQLSQNNFVTYTPIEASERGFINLANFIQTSFETNFRILQQLPSPWK